MTAVCRACVMGGCKTHVADNMGYPDDHPRWNGEVCHAVRVRLRLANPGVHPEYWAAHLDGTVRDAVRVEYDDDRFYLDNEDGSGWAKVTQGGSPRRPHRSLYGTEVSG